MSAAKEKFLIALGKKIKTLREAKGLSQYAFSDISGISRSQVTRIENGDLNFTMATLLMLAEALEISVQELMEV